MNVLYLYRQSDWGHEIKYSLRSVSKYVNPGVVYVAGDAVNLNVESIPIKQHDEKFQDVCNVLKCALHLIDDKEVLLMHDDFFLLDTYTPCIYYNGLLKDRMKRTGGARCKVFDNTARYLDDTAKNYALHYPLPIRTELMRAICDTLTHPFSYMNAYGNLDIHFKQKSKKDCKFNANLLTKPYLKGMMSFSTYNESDKFKTLLDQLYPYKSIYES